MIGLMLNEGVADRNDRSDVVVCWCSSVRILTSDGFTDLKQTSNKIDFSLGCVGFSVTPNPFFLLRIIDLELKQRN